MGEIGFDYMDRMQCQLEMTMAITWVVRNTSPKMLTPPPLSVGGEAWVILQPRTPMKRLFKHKSPLKMNVEGHSAQGVVQVRWLGWKHGHELTKKYEIKKKTSFHENTRK